MTQSIYISDTGNNRIIDRSLPDLSFISEFNDEGYISRPLGLCNDGVYLYILNANNNEILKYIIGNTAADLLYDSGLGSIGSGNDEFNNPKGMCTDGTNLYIVDAGNLRVVKRSCSDLSYITEISAFDSGDQFWNPVAVETDNTYIYVTDWRTSFGRWIKKFACSDLSWDSTSLIAGSGRLSGINIDGLYLFATQYAPFM